MEMITGIMELGVAFMYALMILMVLNVIITEVTNVVELVREKND